MQKKKRKRVEKTLLSLPQEKENLYTKRAEVWKWLTSHKTDVLKAGFTSATDAVNKTLGKDGANRFFRSVNHAKVKNEI